MIRNVIIYLTVFCKDIFSPEKSKGNSLQDIISYNNNLIIIIINRYLILGKYKRWRREFLHNLHSSLKFMRLKFEIDIFDSLEIIPFSAA